MDHNPYEPPREECREATPPETSIVLQELRAMVLGTMYAAVIGLIIVLAVTNAARYFQ